MTRKTFAILGFALLGTGAVCAADVPQVRSALIPDVTVLANDSPLVRAAKIIALNRARMAVHSTRVIDNDTLRQMGSSHFSVATKEAAPLPPAMTVTPAAPVSPYRQGQVVPPNLGPVIAAPPTPPPAPFQLTPPPPTSSPTPYRPPQ